MGPGQSFGEIALIFSAPRTASVVAERNTTLVRIDREGYDHVLRWGAHGARLAVGRARLHQAAPYAEPRRVPWHPVP